MLYIYKKRYKVSDDFNLNICKNFYGYNNSSERCTTVYNRKQACLNYAGEHSSNKCTVTTNKCINCVNVNSWETKEMSTTVQMIKIIVRPSKLNRIRQLKIRIPLETWSAFQSYYKIYVVNKKWRFYFKKYE